MEKQYIKKTIQITMPSAYNGGDIEVNLPNYDNVIDIHGWFKNQNNDYIIMNPSYEGYIVLYYRESNNKLHVGYLTDPTWAHGKTAYITFQYTVKTAE